MVDIPLRHNLAMDSLTSLEIQDYNMQLNISATIFRNVELVEMNFNRKCFTKHELHLNNAAK